MSDTRSPADRPPAPPASGVPPAPCAPRGSGFGLFIACATVVGAFLTAIVATRPIAPLGVDAPPGAFSAARAELVLRDLLREGVPHPVGSDANRIVRDRIVSHLRAAGLEAQVERHWVVAPNENVCAWVENIVARIPGSGPGPAVVLAAHYDSVPAGPGASDDGTGVATVIETARALRAGPALPRAVTLLLTDGEEAGLLGARAHVRAHGVDDVAAVVNVEARGTSGPSLMFETGPGTAATVPAWASGAGRPISSSLFASVYRRMPNDTDLTVFRQVDVPGLNFACVGSVQHYHTPLDSVANADLRTLQHHGDNALSAVRGLATAELGQWPVGEAPELSWFDVLGRFTVRWPIGWTLPLASFALAVLVLGVAVRLRRAEIRGAQVVWGCLAALVTLGAAAACVAGIGWMFGRSPAVSGAFVASPGGPLAAAAGMACLVAGAVGVLAARLAGPRGLWTGAWLAVGGGGVALAVVLPEAAWTLLVPALVAALTDAALAFRPRSGSEARGLEIATVVPLAAACALWFPFTPLVTDALGVAWLVVPAIPFVLVATVFLPAVAAGGPRRAMVATAGLVLAVFGVAATLLAPPWTPDLPRRLNVAWTRDAGDRHAHWIVRGEGALPDAMLAAHAFGDETERVVPYETARGWATEAPFVDLPGPALADLNVRSVDASRRIRFRLTSRTRRSSTCTSRTSRGACRRARTRSCAPARPTRRRVRTATSRSSTAGSASERGLYSAIRGASDLHSMADAAISHPRTDSTRMTKLSPTARKFIRDWGELADRWGVDRATAEVHALLYVAKAPMDLGSIAEALGIGTDDAQVGLEALRAMGVVQLAARNAGSLRYECLPDVWEMFRAILEERRRREVEPAVATLRDALLRADNDPECDEHTRRRLEEMQVFLRDSLGLCKQFSSMPGPEVRRLLKMGGKIRKALGLAE